MEFLYIISIEIVLFFGFLWMLQNDIDSYERELRKKRFPPKPKEIKLRGDNYPFE